jgi:hypothetical protein
MPGIPTPEEVARTEQTYEPGRVPEVVWLEHLRLNAIVAVEIIPYKIVDGKVKVYMIRRPTNDPFYPNQLHTPGTMCNGNDKTIEDAVQRVMNEEISEFTTDRPEEIDTLYRSTPRGVEGAFIFSTRVIDGGNPENWYDAENLPKDTIEHHQEMIKIVLPKLSKGVT